jgi:mutator protein MutT
VAPIVVVAAVIEDDEAFLLTLRPDGTHLAGHWEFPGGKCHAGEPPAACTARECLEEVGIPVRVLGLRRVVRHRYPHAFVELHFHDCEPLAPHDEPDPESGFRWVALPELSRYRFPEASETVVADLLAEAP